MSNLSYEYIQFLNEKILENLPRNYVRVGDKINLRCPLCGDSKKSSRKKRGWIYLKTSSYYCFNCSTGLSGIKFLEYISGNNYEDIKREYTKLFLKSGLNTNLSSIFNIPTSEPSLFQLESIVKPEWKKPLSPSAINYLKNRRVLDAPFLYEQFYSCYGKNNEEYIMIPWKINGIDAFYQLNDFKKHHAMKYIFPKDKKKLIYGLDNIDISWPYLIITEGVFDSLFIKNGICSGTKSITQYQLDLIHERYPHHQIVISFDNDKAGIVSIAKLLEQNRNFKYFRWFNSNTKEKDINDYILAKNNVNIFTEPKILEKMIVDKLVMKMHLIQNNMWRIA
jgi:hypothetical protein